MTQTDKWVAKVRRRQGFAERRRDGEPVTFAQVLAVGVGCVLAGVGLLMGGMER